MKVSTVGNARTTFTARDRFWGSSLGLTNLHFATFAYRPEWARTHRSLLVVDECHGLEPMLLSLYKPTLYRNDVVKLGVDYRQDIPSVISGVLARLDELEPDGPDRDYGDAGRLREVVPDINQRGRIHSVARRLRGINLADTANPWQSEKARSVDTPASLVCSQPLATFTEHGGSGAVHVSDARDAGKLLSQSGHSRKRDCVR